MAYVAPNTDVRLLADVPIDMDYGNTLWFADASEQYTYFISKTKKQFPRCSYTRNTPGFIKLEVSADAVRDCNYMMYRNTAFTDKWFYAFIIGITYISNNVCGVTFVIDQLQTWLFNAEFSDCFIERQHSTTDSAGDNLIPEGLETGEYMYQDNNLDWSKTFTGYDVVVYTTFSSSKTTTGGWTFTNSQGTYRWGIYTGLNMRVFRHVEDENTVTELNSFFTAVVEFYGEDNGVVALVMVPSDSLDDKLLPTQISHSIPKITSLDYYTPKNKKLLTYPYCFIEVQNCEGATAALRQEYFGGQNPAICQFMITFNISAAPVALCVPINYKGAEYNYYEGIFINNFTQCSYNTDMYKAYMAQTLSGSMLLKAEDYIQTGKSIAHDAGYIFNSMIEGMKTGNIPQYTTPSDESVFTGSNAREALPRATAAAMGAIAGGTALTYLYGTPSGASTALAIPSVLGDKRVDAGTLSQQAVSAASQIYNQMQALYSHAVAAPHNTGANTPDYFTSNRLKGFWMMHRTITNEFARKIDKYFTMFGYAQHNVAKPNLHARSRFTYIKTVGANVHGDLPVEAATLIQNVLNNGIRFWADKDNVGDFDIDNPIV